MKKKALLILALAACLLTGCGGKQLSERAKSAQSAIDALPSAYSEDAENAYSNAKLLYDVLTDEEKKDVNKEKLDALEQSRDDIVKKPAEEVNQKIRELTLKYSTAAELQQSADDIEEIVNEIDALSPLSAKAVDIRKLTEKTDDILEHVNTYHEYEDDDFDHITKVIENYNSVVNNLSLNNPREAHLEMIDVVNTLKEIYLHDKSAALAAAQIFLEDCKAIADGSEFTDSMLEHASTFEDECTVLQESIKKDYSAYLDAYKKLIDVTKRVIDLNS
ncbi:MAG: hypothetical protein IKQ39_04820 [Oscillospiraceae bacterium]|nr:hypothetical protein [Oscillospiraceae bacterium]